NFNQPASLQNGGLVLFDQITYNTTQHAINIEIVDGSGNVTNATTFNNAGKSQGATKVYGLPDGNFVLTYDDGSQAYFRVYDSSLNLIRQMAIAGVSAVSDVENLHDGRLSILVPGPTNPDGTSPMNYEIFDFRTS